MKKSERILIIVTVCTGIFAALYIYVIEPNVKTLFVSNSLEMRNKEYLNLLHRKNEIEKNYNEILLANYWKSTPQEQRTAFQIFMESIIRKSGISQITSIVPSPGDAATSSDEIVLQIDVECTISALTELLSEVGDSKVPLQIKRLQINGETGVPNILKAQIEVSTLFVNVNCKS